MGKSAAPAVSAAPPASVRAATRAPARSPWLERWLETCADLSALKATHPMLDAVIERAEGRHICVGGHWLIDFASCNYLGLDLDREVIDAIPRFVDGWGTHPSWSRLLGSPILYEQIEAKVTELLGAEDTLALPTITHIHTSVLPVLAGGGTVFLDGRAHKTIYDGSLIASSHGALLQRFRHNDHEHLESLLRKPTPTPRVVCMDGVNSMTGNAPDIAEFARVARAHDALLYVDDAHGFGVVGERAGDEPCVYGRRGNGVVRHFGESYDNVVFVAGFSKAYSSLLAFVACPTELKGVLKVAAPPYLYSGPSPVASLATALVGLQVNDERGDAIRADLHRKTERVLSFLRQQDVATPNETGTPIIEIPLRDHQDIHEVGELLFRRGVYVTLAAYPLVPKAEVGFRVQVTAANSDEDISHLIEVLAEVGERFRLRTPAEAAERSVGISEQPPSPR